MALIRKRKGKKKKKKREDEPEDDKQRKTDVNFWGEVIPVIFVYRVNPSLSW